MSYVAAAYLLSLAVLGLYLWTLWRRGRELRRAVRDPFDRAQGGRP